MNRMLAHSLIGAQVLVIDADERVQQGVVPLLAEASLHVTCVDDPARGLEVVGRQFFSVVLVDLDTPSPGAGLETIRAIKLRSPTSMVIALTPRRSYDDAVLAVRAGAVDLVLKAPESVAYLRERVVEAAGRSAGQREVDHVLVDVRDVMDEFLQRFMDAERRALDATDVAAGRSPGRGIDVGELRVLVVDEADDLCASLQAAAPAGFAFVHATSGGEALDRATSGQFHYAMVADDLHDLPSTILLRSLRTQAPDVVLFAFLGPADNGHVSLVEAGGLRPLVQPFTDVAQVLGRMGEFAEAWQAKARERRVAQAFRERNYDLLRKFVELKTKLERASTPGHG